MNTAILPKLHLHLTPHLRLVQQLLPLQRKAYQHLLEQTIADNPFLEWETGSTTSLETLDEERAITDDYAPLIPDAVVAWRRGYCRVQLVGASARRLQLEPTALRLLRAAATPADTKQYLRQALGQAKTLLTAVKGRQHLLTVILSYVAEHQRPWWQEDQPLRPLTQRHIAAALRLHPSTISRALRDKYLRLPTGRTVAAQHLLSRSLKTMCGELTSSRTCQERLCELVHEEPSRAPLSDRALQTKLHAAGFLVSRRTIAKYRARLRIPAAHRRRLGRRVTRLAG